MHDDATLLRRYADDGSQAAFTELVRRHVDLVYGAALRRTNGNTHRAADVAQQVFTALARDARKLSRHPVLGAWLHTATRNAALNLLIAERRRQTHEAEAATMSNLHADPAAPVWERLRPELDAAIDELPEPDRAAVVLRFLERRPFAEIGAALRVTEDAARMRTDRALDRLRTALERRGITSTAAALSAVVAGQPVIAAPAGLAATLAASATAQASAAAGGFLTLFAFMNAKNLTATAVIALFTFGLGLYIGLNYTLSQPLPPPPETPGQVLKIDSLRKENLGLRAEVDRLNAEKVRLAAPPPRPTPSAVRPAVAAAEPITETQRAILNNLRQLEAARDQFILENRRPPASLEEIVGEQRYIRRLISVQNENYAQLSLQPGQTWTLMASNGETVTYETGDITKPPTLEEQRANALRVKIMPAMRKANEAYKAANNGASAPAIEGIIPYFATPQEGADFVEYLEAQKVAAAARNAARKITTSRGASNP